MDFTRILNKPFFIQNISWPTTAAANASLLNLSLPSGLLQNVLVKIPFNSTSLFRMKGCVMLQVAGTPMHQGICVASVVPDLAPTVNVTQLLQAPHAFLVANESTPICVEFPFYSRLNLVSATTSAIGKSALSDLDYAKLVVHVVNPLLPGTSATTPITISVHVMITDLEMYVPKNDSITWLTACGMRPRNNCISEGNSVSVKFTCIEGEPTEEFVTHSFTNQLFRIPTQIFDGLAKGAKTVTGDFIDAVRSGLRQLTGFHNPNSPAINERMIVTTRNFGNNVDQPTLMEKLDQHAQFDRIVTDYIFDTDVDEMDVSYMLSKPMYEATFQVTTTDISSKLLFSRPITPFVETATTTYYSPLRKLYECSRYWRGGLKVHIQSSMTNFHYCKLLLVRNYQPTNDIFTKYPKMTDVVNLMTETLEFSAGGQILTVDLPFCSQLEQLECTKNLKANAAMHGMFYIYLLQPLVANGAVPLNVNFNVYFSVAEDFQFYGYATDLTTTSVPTAFMTLKEEDAATKRFIESRNDFVNTGARIIPTEEEKAVAAIMNTAAHKDINDRKAAKLAQEQSEAAKNPKPRSVEFITHSGVNAIVGVSDQSPLMNDDELKPTSLRMDDFKPMTNIRDYIRRIVNTQSIKFTPDANNLGVCVIPVNSLLRNANLNPGFKSIISNYLGFSGGLKIKVVVNSDTPFMVNYLPPSIVHDGLELSQAVPNPTATSFYAANFAYGIGNMNNSTPVIEITRTSNPKTDTTKEQRLVEFVIPNMNPFRFIRHLPTLISIDPDTDMGHIIFSYHPTTLTENLMSFYVGFTDETRFGFQSVAYPHTTPTNTIATVIYRLTPYNVPSAPYANPVDPSTVKFCYFTKLV